jgi:hypothetical protein
MEKILDNILVDSIGSPNRRFSRPPSRNDAKTPSIEQLPSKLTEIIGAKPEDVVTEKQVEAITSTPAMKTLPPVVIPSLPISVDALKDESLSKNLVEVEIHLPGGEQSLITVQPILTVPNQLYEEIHDPADLRPGDIAIVEYPSLIPRPPQNYRPILMNHHNTRIPVIKKHYSVRFQEPEPEKRSVPVAENTENRAERPKSKQLHKELHPKLMLTSKGIFSERTLRLISFGKDENCWQS